MPNVHKSDNAALLCRTPALKTLLGHIKSRKPKGLSSLGRFTPYTGRSKDQSHLAVKELTFTLLKPGSSKLTGLQDTWRNTNLNFTCFIYHFSLNNVSELK